ncbi:RDD family protein [Streptomyces turgidiscabies]|uniref:RDD family membrane protein YckC n=1 Tax=Streptomyces turgidiscabies TaxID=85558 RepID=A0ABU0RER1_9ACTN|nr:RDD family protein [Streptomyces turgidiscabies]MDQ0930474.1 putative RDD family membrane protein YckC [Streptomyces turgidiscabies]
MSAPTPAPGDDRPREGYYPDPSIPGYVRFWNGSSWVPGTSRPAPSDGASVAARAEETGPHFFDEDPRSPGAEPRRATPAEAQHGSRPEPASAWGADRSHQSGFGGDRDRQVSWGSPAQTADPRTADPRAAVEPPVQPDGWSARTDGSATIPPVEQDAGDVPESGTFVFRRPTPGPAAAGPAPSEGTMTFRAPSPRTGRDNAAGGAQPGSTSPPEATQGPVTAPAPAPAQGPGFGAGKAAAARAAAAPGAAPAPLPATPAVPRQNAPGTGAPMAPDAGGGQPSWAQQVHRLAAPEEGGEPRVTPWKPPVEDVFQAAARRQAAARPAGLGKRLVARLVDTLVLGALTAVAAVPLGTLAVDHVTGKIDAAKVSGETVTVWLLDGTTGLYLGIVLAVLLLAGVLSEAWPTAKWGRTLGKKLVGLEVRDIEGHEPPSFGAALRRWLVYCVPGLLGIGVVGVLWCLFDRPWRQGWHDKAAHTFVAG